MKNKLVLLGICILLVILDNAFCPFISIKGAYPSLLFVFAIAYSIINGKEESVYIGVISGLLQDVFFINGMGINALVNMLLCLLAAIIGESIFKNKKLIPIVACGGISLLKVILIFIIFKAFNLSMNLNSALLSVIYNIVIMFLGYKYVLKLSNLSYMKREWRFK